MGQEVIHKGPEVRKDMPGTAGSGGASIEDVVVGVQGGICARGEAVESEGDASSLEAEWPRPITWLTMVVARLRMIP